MAEWNLTQAAFYLLATIIGVEVLLVVSTYVLCAWFNVNHPEAPTPCDGLRKPLMDILQDCIATVMAYSAGRLSRDGGSNNG
jgi:hypothetical protein